jgi:subtilisin family serine protease
MSTDTPSLARLRVVPPGRLHALERDPRVAFVEANQVVSIFDHVTPNGILRANADVSNTNYSVDADIAIIDTGIELDNPDLNVFKYANCARKGPLNTSCNENDDGADDGNGHGTHVAGTAAAKNNNIGAVGMAPGARLWAVKVLGNDGSGWMNWIIGGIDYVTANADQIDVANMSLGCKCDSNALDAALTNSVAAGVTFAVAAGNSMEDASTFSPANHPDVITVSAMADFDGVGGGLTDTTVTFGICTEYEDDSFACFSNYGEDVNIAAPGVNILSTALGGGTATLIPS